MSYKILGFLLVLSFKINLGLTQQNSSQTKLDPYPPTIQSNSTESPIPRNCEGYTLLREQPIFKNYSSVKKCCKEGEMINEERGECEPVLNLKFNPNVIMAKFFEDCIEDEEKIMKLKIQISPINCTGTLHTIKISSDDVDNIYVIQDGSLLIVERNFTGYSSFNEYCIDLLDDGTGPKITALACATDNLFTTVSKAQSYIYAACMLVSVPCLILTAFLYVAIPKLRNLHGKSLACHCICLAAGFGLLAIMQLIGEIPLLIGYIIQYLILACFFWMMAMCVDICIHVWFYLPKQIEQKPIWIHYHFFAYSIICFFVPLALVIATYQAGIPGMPSYYLKGINETTRSTQIYFIPPITATLIIDACFYVAIYFGFRELHAISSLAFLVKKNLLHMNPDLATQDFGKICTVHVENVKIVAKSTLYLYAIMAINWIFEIISFYVQGSESSLVLFDIINALQGILIFLIFVYLPYPRNIIIKWWKDRGSLEICETELEVLKQPNNNKF